MPRQVDHERRRRDIAAAVWRLAARRGLEDVTLRQVATEAGVSARQLQYWFGTREQLLLGALEILNAEAEQQAAARMAGLGENPRPRDVVRGVLHELLPLDEERWARSVVYAAYFVRFLTEPALAEVARRAPDALGGLVTDLVTLAQAAGDVPADVDARTESAVLLATAGGLQTEVLLGRRTPDEAVGLLDHQIARVFPPR
jgi:AcrR family transcriptional regulator